jgi:hypothetical protein
MATQDRSCQGQTGASFKVVMVVDMVRTSFRWVVEDIVTIGATDLEQIGENSHRSVILADSCSTYL